MNLPADAFVSSSDSWGERNQRWLSQRFDFWREQIEQLSGSSSNERPALAPPPTPDDCAAHQLRDVFNLTEFEIELLLLAAGAEINLPLRDAIARAQSLSAAGPVRLRFSMALALLAEPHWDAISPERPLRYWSLLDADTEHGLSQTAFRADERIIHFLTGVTAFDARLLGFAEHQSASRDWTAEPFAKRIADAMRRVRDPLVLLSRPVGDTSYRPHARAMATAAFSNLGLQTLSVSIDAVASLTIHGDGRELLHFARHLDREAALTGAGVVLCPGRDPASDFTMIRLVATLRSPVIVLGALSSVQIAELPSHHVLRFDLPETHAAPLRKVPVLLKDAAQRALHQFRVEPAFFEQAVNAVSGISDAGAAEKSLWSVLRELARGGLDALAQRIASRTCFDDLVVPPQVTRQLRDISNQLRYRQQVYVEWGFGDGQDRGLGIAALFAGESGTGKTMAAEVIANEAGLDLYRIDLANVVSKYIGETEKNLSRLFEAAERSGAVLLFDEADALFGKRSEVKDSHDRYANIEVAYLLQRIESYRGLAILTTNLKGALDRAFLRRIRFVVQFPIPDEPAREQIWRRQFPRQSPLGDVDFAQLARLQLSGGHIRSVALNAAFHAASRGESIGQSALIEAARAEFLKLERSFHAPQGGGS